jgi:hypothetical protein
VLAQDELRASRTSLGEAGGRHPLIVLTGTVGRDECFVGAQWNCRGEAGQSWIGKRHTSLRLPMVWRAAFVPGAQERRLGGFEGGLCILVRVAEVRCYREVERGGWECSGDEHLGHRSDLALGLLA